MHEVRRQVGPVRFRLVSQRTAALAESSALYAGYAEPDFCDFTVRLEAPRPWRRFIRPNIRLAGDFTASEAAPLPLSHALLGAEMAMNLQVALGWRRHLVIHASAVEKDGRALLMTGRSGSGKSTLAALLGERGWRFMGDEFALLDLESGMVHPFPRLVSLKNEAIAVMEREVPADRLGPLLTGTPKGDIRHLVPPRAAVSAMEAPARPALLVYPRFGYAAAVRPMGEDENFLRLTQASTNYVALGEAGFAAMVRLVRDVPVRAMDFDDGEAALAEIERLWSEGAAA